MPNRATDTSDSTDAAAKRVRAGGTGPVKGITATNGAADRTRYCHGLDQGTAMRWTYLYTCLLSGLFFVNGCTGARTASVDQSTLPNRPLKATDAQMNPRIAQVVHQVDATEPNNTEPNNTKPDNAGTITLNGRTYRIQLLNESTTPEATQPRLRQVHHALQQTTGADAGSADTVVDSEDSADESASATVPPDAILLNLPSALAMVDGKHPAVGFAQWKVQEAYANLEQAESLWLPSIQTGFSFHRHDGNYQASNGDIVDVNRSSFQYGLGAGATGAGTTPVPGLRAQFHLADAIFAPDIAQKTAWATGHAQKAVINRQLRDVALAYLKLLDAHQQLRILEQVRDRTAELAKITNDFAGAGQGLQADADRMQTELMLVKGRIATALENVDVMSARLAHALSADVGHRIIPTDVTVLPLELIPADRDKASLIAAGLAARPELRELQALVSAACDRHQRQKYAPFVPSVLLGFSAGGFGGDTGNAINRVDDRYDFDAMVTWEIRNFGFGERSARRRTEAQVQQAMYRKVALIDDVAREISEAHTQMTHRRERMEVTQHSIQTARDSYDRNLSRIRDGEGLPIEVMLSVKALEAAQRAYLDSVVAYNESQFQLQWSLGWQVSASNGR